MDTIHGMMSSIMVEETFHEEKWMYDISDVYNLDYEKISQLEGFGERSATKLEAAIEKAKQNPIHKLLHSLSIHHLGKKASKLLAQEINHVFDLKTKFGEGKQNCTTKYNVGRNQNS